MSQLLDPLLNPLVENYIEKHIKKKYDAQSIKLIDVEELHGGCINQVSLLTLIKNDKNNQQIKLVLKENQQKPAGFFERELIGLTALLEGVTKNNIPIIVPQPIGFHQSNSNYQFLLIEYIEPDSSNPSSRQWGEFGRGLASFHQSTGNSNSSQYGWSGYNYIGLNKQKNIFASNWVDFFREQRLNIQIEWADQNGYLDSGLKKKLLQLCEELGNFLPSHPLPCLVHGDLWGGNVFFSRDKFPVIYDPAVYQGDGETDLALTELFGRLPEAFYQGYREVFPNQPGYQERKTIYNLYHLLNHLNLFGRSYLSGVINSVDRLL